MISALSHTTAPSECSLTAGTRFVGTISLYQAGLSCRLTSSVSNGTPFAISCSHTFSQNGHQPLVSR